MKLLNSPLNTAKQCFKELKIDECKPQNVFLKMTTYFFKKKSIGKVLLKTH